MRRRALAGTPGSVNPMHCGARDTVDLLPGIIDDYLARGYRFVTVPELLGIPWTAPEPPSRHSHDRPSRRVAAQRVVI